MRCPKCGRTFVPDPVYAAMSGPPSAIEYHRLAREWQAKGCIAFIMGRTP